MRFYAALALSCIFSACGGSRATPLAPPSNLENPENSKSGNSENPKTIQLNNLSLNSATNETIISIKSDFQGVKAYRFSLPKNGTLDVSKLSNIQSCNGDPELSLTVRKFANGVLSEEAPIADLSKTVSVTLKSGEYAIAISKAPQILCKELALELKVNLKLDAEAKAVDKNADANPNSRPVDPESNRIALKELKDSAGLDFIAFASKEEGCVPVIRRSMADIKKNAGSLLANSAQPLSMSVQKSGLDPKYEFWGQSLLGAQNIFSFTVYSNPGYASDWAQQLNNALLLRSETVKIALNSSCKSATLPWVHIFAFNDFPVGEDPLPLKRQGHAPDIQFTYNGSSNPKSLIADIGLDRAKLMEDFPGETPANISKLEWMVSHKSSDYYFPVTDWNTLDVKQLFSDKLQLDLGPVAGRGIYHFHASELAFRFTDTKNNTKMYHLDFGKLCQAAYTRTDGAAFHSQLFHDLAHPEWNNSPSKELKQGCAYIGEQWWSQ